MREFFREIKKIMNEIEDDMQKGIDDFAEDGDSLGRKFRERQGVSSITAIPLNDTYITDLVCFNCVPILDEKPAESFYTRKYYNGYLQYGDYCLKAKFIDYESGNMSVLSIDGDGSEELFGKIMERKEKRSFTLTIRKLISYVFLIGTAVMAPIISFMFFTLNLKGVFLSFIYFAVIRTLYVISRNHLR